MRVPTLDAKLPCWGTKLTFFIVVSQTLHRSQSDGWKHAGKWTKLYPRCQASAMVDACSKWILHCKQGTPWMRVWTGVCKNLLLKWHLSEWSQLCKWGQFTTREFSVENNRTVKIWG